MLASFRVVEESRARLVLRANWLNHLGGALIFGFVGALFLFMAATFENRVSSVCMGIVGLGACAVGVQAVAIGLAGSRRRILFDRGAREIRREHESQGAPRVPFRDVARVDQRVLEGIRDQDSALVYHCLYLVTTRGEEIEVCQSRDPELIKELAFKIRAALGEAAAGGPSYDGRPMSYWMGLLAQGGPSTSADWEAAPTAVRTIGEAAVPAVLGILADPDAAIRTRAGEALLFMEPKPREAVPALIRRLGDKDQGVRHLAARVLANIGPGAKAAEPRLVEGLEDPVPEVRHAMAVALGALGPAAAEAIPALERALDDESAVVRDSAAEALRKIGGRSLE